MTVSPQVIPQSTFDLLIWNWNGHQIRYTVAGQGQPLLLVHGFGASIGHWRKNIPALAKAGFQVFAVDLLGFGASDKPALDYTLDLWVDLLHDFWMAHIQQPTVWVGNSIGALIGLMTIAQFPETAAGGILLNSAGGLNHRPDELNPILRVVMGTFTRLVKSPIVGPLLFNQIRQKHRIRRTLTQVYRNAEAITDELVELLYAPSCDPGAQRVFASVLTAPPGPTPAELLPQISCPLLVLWGEDDPWTPIRAAQIYQQLHNDLTPSQIPPIQFVSIPKTGHCPHDERPEVVNPLMIDWLRKLPK
ncbi:MAG: alpha/beta fold hydrolase [Leptolyngbyaceae cyanobacterium bins.59]|nr:alpha/beta fold hydrolase [Leptolyngbyaceae cyanobacterium bins.59]